MSDSTDRLRLEMLRRAAVKGAYGAGNINLFTRPLTRNPDELFIELDAQGNPTALPQVVPSHSSIYSMSGGYEGPLYPGVGEHGEGILSRDAAKAQFQRTGHQLGTADPQDMLSNALHLEGQAGLTTPPLATHGKAVNPDQLQQVLLWLLTKDR